MQKREWITAHNRDKYGTAQAQESAGRGFLQRRKVAQVTRPRYPENKKIMRKKKKKPEQTIEILAEQYRACIMSTGDVDRADELIDQIRPPCKALMAAHGIEWDQTLDQFLHCVLLGYSRYSGEQFLVFFLRNARRNFDIPTADADKNYFHGTKLTPFLQTWESQPEKLSILKADKALKRKRQSERRAAADQA